MKVRKWVDFGVDVDVEIGVDDIRGAISEACSNVTQDRLGEPGPNRAEVVYAVSCCCNFLKAMTDEHISLMTEQARTLVSKFLAEQAERFSIGGLFKPAIAADATSREASAGSTESSMGLGPAETTVSGQSL